MAKNKRPRVRPKTLPTGDDRLTDVASLQPKGVPTDDHGMPLEDVELDEEKIRALGAVDAESARDTFRSRLTVAAKSKGRPAKWNDTDDAIRFWEAYQIFNDCMIKVLMISPNTDHSIDAMPMRLFQGDFSLLTKKIKETHWKQSQAATYSWKCYDRTHPKIATGKFTFDERGDEDMSQQRNNGPPPGGYYPPPHYQQPPPQYPPYGAPPQGYPYGQPYYQPPPQAAPYPYAQPAPPPQPYPEQAPPPQQPAQVAATPQQPQQPAPQPYYAPPPPPPPPGAQHDQSLLQAYLQLAHAHAAMAAQQAHAPVPGYYPPPPPGYYPPPQHQPQQTVQGQPATHPVAEGKVEAPAKPATPAQALKENLDTVMSVFSVGRKFAEEFSGKTDEPDEPETPAPKKDEKPFPVQSQDFGSARLLAVDGELVESFWPNMFANSDKAMVLGNTLVDKLGNLFTKITEGVQKKDDSHKDAMERAQKKLEINERTAQAYERAAQAQEKLRANAAATPMPQQIVVVDQSPMTPTTPFGNGYRAPEPEPAPHPISAEIDEETPPERVETAPPNGSAAS